MSWLVPTATMRSPRTATACAIENASSTVMIFPFVRIVSAGCCCAWRNTAAPKSVAKQECKHPPFNAKAAMSEAFHDAK